MGILTSVFGENTVTKGLESAGGAIGSAVSGGDVVKGTGEAVAQGARGIDKGVAYMAGAGIEDKVEAAAKLLEGVGPEGIPVTGSPSKTGEILHAALGINAKGQIGPKTMEAMNADLVKKFAPEPEVEEKQDPNMGAAESTVRSWGTSITGAFSSVKEAVTGGALADKYQDLAKQVQDAVAATPEGQAPVVIASRDQITGMHMKFYMEQLCEKNAFDGNKVLTATIGEAIGNELAPAVTATGLKGYGAELQAIGNSLAPELVKAPEGFKPTEETPAPDAMEPGN